MKTRLLWILSLGLNATIVLGWTQLQSTETLSGVTSRTKLITQTHVHREEIPQLSSRTDLIKESPIPHDHVHQVIIVVQQNNMDELTRILHDVSDPMSPRYGQHMSGEQIHAMTSNLEARDAIVAYLHLNGASIVSETLSGDSMTVNAPISAWERVLDTKFTMFHQLQAEGTVETIVRAKTYSIPRELDVYVDSVLNVIELPYCQSRLQKAPTENHFEEQATDLYGYLRPQDIRHYYNMSNVFGSAQSTQAAVGFGPNYFSPKSLAYFQQNISYQDPQPALNIGGYESENPADDSTEGNLDIQYIIGISRDSPTTFWHDPGGFSTWLTAVINNPNPPLVLSISYGIPELYTALGTHRYVTNLAKKLGLMGVTLVVACGDDGAVGPDARGNPDKCSYEPYFPAGNPYFTAIGGTAVRCAP